MRALALLLILLMPVGVGAATADTGSVTAALPSVIERLQERKAIDAAMAAEKPKLWSLQPITKPAVPAGATLLIAEPFAGNPSTARVTDAYFNLYFAAMGQGRTRSPQEIAALAGTAKSVMPASSPAAPAVRAETSSISATWP